MNGVTFDSCFDSGNLKDVEEVTFNVYNLWISPDCAKTKNEKFYTTWFYFSGILLFYKLLKNMYDYQYRECKLFKL